LLNINSIAMQEKEDLLKDAMSHPDKEFCHLGVNIYNVTVLYNAIGVKTTPYYFIVWYLDKAIQDARKGRTEYILSEIQSKTGNIEEIPFTYQFQYNSSKEIVIKEDLIFHLQ